MVDSYLKIGAFVALTLILTGAIIISDADKERAYYCKVNDMVSLCDKLTTNNTRCYFVSPSTNKTTYKGCSSGWEKMTFETEQKQSLCYDSGKYQYCCESKQLESKGSCDFIIRR